MCEFWKYVLVILFFWISVPTRICYFERRETLGARETPRRSRPFARSMSFGPSASPRRSPKGAVLAAVAAGDAMLDAEAADLRWSLKRSHSTPPAPRRAVLKPRLRKRSFKKNPRTSRSSLENCDHHITLLKIPRIGLRKSAEVLNFSSILRKT